MGGASQCYWKVSCKQIRKSIKEIPIYANFSYICVPKPVGHIDPSRFERVKSQLVNTRVNRKCCNRFPFPLLMNVWILALMQIAWPSFHGIIKAKSFNRIPWHLFRMKRSQCQCICICFQAPCLLAICLCAWTTCGTCRAWASVRNNCFLFGGIWCMAWCEALGQKNLISDKINSLVFLLF